MCPKANKSAIRAYKLHENARKKLVTEVRNLRRVSFSASCYVVNYSPEYLPSYTIEVAEANSWSQDHQMFLPNKEFRRSRIATGKDIAPVTRVEKGDWLVRANVESSQLVVSSSSNPLVWPNTDPSKTQIWRLKLTGSYQRPNHPNPGNSNPIALAERFLLIRWDTDKRTFRMMEYKD